jgi:alcohol dehydrogenase class IV
MSCWHYYASPAEPTGHGVGDPCFSIDAASITFGRGALAEAGSALRLLGCRRVAVFTDRTVQATAWFPRVPDSLAAAGLDAAIYDRVRIEPDEPSFQEAARFFREGRFDGLVSVGGGSVIDTGKAAALLARYPAELNRYLAPPLGQGEPVPGPLPPHVACPTTCGTGSECTGIAVFSLPERRTKAGVSHRLLRPGRALVDPVVTTTLPSVVVASSGFDVLCHALESYTARPHTRRPPPASPEQRPLSQGANPYSDIGCREALLLCGRYLVRALSGDDLEAREQLLFAAMLAGIAFGNAGVHAPHGMAYAVAGGAHGAGLAGYPADQRIIPHGVSVILSAPAAFAYTAVACPERHLEAAGLLGAEVRGASAHDAGEVLTRHLLHLMQATGQPHGLHAVGYGEADVAGLAAAARLQRRLLDNAPRPIDDEALAGLFRAALHYSTGPTGEHAAASAAQGPHGA